MFHVINYMKRDNGIYIYICLEGFRHFYNLIQFPIFLIETIPNP